MNDLYLGVGEAKTIEIVSVSAGSKPGRYSSRYDWDYEATVLYEGGLYNAPKVGGVSRLCFEAYKLGVKNLSIERITRGHKYEKASIDFDVLGVYINKDNNTIVDNNVIKSALIRKSRINYGGYPI